MHSPDRMDILDRKDVPEHPDAEMYKEAARLVAQSAEAGHMDLWDEHCAEIVATYLQDERILPLVRSLETEDPASAYHSIRVAELALDVGRELGSPTGASLPRGDARTLVLAALLHDAGKRETPPEVLKKPGELTKAEKGAMREHVRAGVNILQSAEGAGIEGRADILAVLAKHHEYLREEPYPRGEQKEYDGPERRQEIENKLERLAQILAVADSFDAQSSDRPYRKDPLSKERIVSNMKTELEGKLSGLIDTTVKRYPEARTTRR